MCRFVSDDHMSEDEDAVTGSQELRDDIAELIHQPGRTRASSGHAPAAYVRGYDIDTAMAAPQLQP